MIEDAANAEWVFPDMQMWTGAILDNGGVAWNRLLEKKNMTVGSHTGKVMFWNKTTGLCASIPMNQKKEGLVLIIHFQNMRTGTFFSPGWNWEYDLMPITTQVLP